MDNILLLMPPIVFILFLLLLLSLSGGLAKFAARSSDNLRELEPFNHGQNQAEQQISAGFGSLLPLAFFFTIMQVVVLVVATTPVDALLLPLIYVAGGILALVIIFRR